MKTNIGVKYKLHQVLSLGPLPPLFILLFPSRSRLVHSFKPLGSNEDQLWICVMHTLRFRSRFEPYPQTRCSFCRLFMNQLSFKQYVCPSSLSSHDSSVSTAGSSLLILA